MQELMRKYRRHILVAVIIVISGPFILWVVPARARKSTALLGTELSDEVVLSVGGIEVHKSEFLRYLEAERQQQSRGDKQVTIRELDENGTVQRVIEALLKQTLLRYHEAQMGFNISDAYAEERLRSWFVAEDGKPDTAAYNQWVKEDPKRNWNAVYADVRDGITRDLTVALMSAPAARVLDKEVEEEVVEAHTKIQVRYLKVQPPVNPTEEEIRKHYDENLEIYREPRTITAAFVRMPLQPVEPESVKQFLDRARAGEDFAKLADEASTKKPEEKDGGFVGWKAPGDSVVDHEQPMFALPVGQVSDPVYGPGGFFIYKVEEERTNADTGQREVLARRIFIPASVTKEEREFEQSKAEVLSERAKALGSLEKAAAELGYTVQRTGTFTKNNTAIEGLPSSDARSFAYMLDAQKDDTKYNVVRAVMAFYVGEVVESQEGAIPAFEAVHDKVREDVINARRQTEEYKTQVQEYVDKIKAQAKTLEEVKTLFPELNAEVKESQEVEAARGNVEGMMANQIFDLVGKSEPGVIAGPVSSFMGDTFFVELIKRTDPTEEERKAETWATELKEKREEKLAQTERIIMDDYMKDLLERSMSTVQIDTNEPLIGELVGRTQPKEEEAPPANDDGLAPGENPAS